MNISSSSSWSIWLRVGVIIAGILMLDQGHKWLMFNHTEVVARGSIELTSFFNLVMVWNPGISFGMFNDIAQSHYVFSALATVIVIALLLSLVKTHHTLYLWAIGCICGGALGNVIDRLRFGAVADFFDFHLYGHHWPAFNIADIAVCVGAFLLCLDVFIQPKSESK